jgi:hypothetical protein
MVSGRRRDSIWLGDYDRRSGHGLPLKESPPTGRVWLMEQLVSKSIPPAEQPRHWLHIGRRAIPLMAPASPDMGETPDTLAH